MPAGDLSRKRQIVCIKQIARKLPTPVIQQHPKPVHAFYCVLMLLLLRSTVLLCFQIGVFGIHLGASRLHSGALDGNWLAAWRAGWRWLGLAGRLAGRGNPQGLRHTSQGRANDVFGGPETALFHIETHPSQHWTRDTRHQTPQTREQQTPRP